MVYLGLLRICLGFIYGWFKICLVYLGLVLGFV